MSTQSQHRGQWRSSLGFVLAAAGSAIGLGNIWRFSYVAGTHGGAAFIAVYLGCIALICLPYLFAELSLGRHTEKNPVGALLAVRPRTRWVLVGGFAVLTGVCILSYYAVIAGWAFGWIFKSVLAPAVPHADFTASPLLSIAMFAVFLALTVAVVLGGVENGIERAAVVLMPVLLALMFVVILRGLTLEGAMQGVEFLLRPDFSRVDRTTVLAALGQAFYSLSLGMGVMITYGSYLPADTDLPKSGLQVALFDTAVALLAGFMIFPALFALGVDPASGPTLIFEVLPEVFRGMPLGVPIMALFFVLLSIAALTSTVSLLEVVVAFFVDERRWSRRKSAVVVGSAAFLLGLPSALSQGAVEPLGEMRAFGVTSWLYIMDLVWGNVALAVGAVLFSLFVGWVWGTARAGAELCRGSAIGGRSIAVWGFCVRWVCPAFILAVLLDLFGAF